MAIRGPTKDEIENVFPHYARGWESQTEEHEFWFGDEGGKGEIEGEVPAELMGTFLRNGPGLTEVHGTPLKHPIDGDGMVCALSFTNGKVHFRNKYVETYTHKKEKEAGRMLFPGQMGSRPPPGGKLSKYRDPSHTNVFYWGGKVLTCHEYALPHCLDPATLETVGRDSLNGTLDIGTFSAHFRLDAEQDLLCTVAFKAGLEMLKTKPQVRLYEYDRAWNMVRKTKVSVPGLNYAHDFGLTPNWYVLHMSPFVNTSKKFTDAIIKGKTSPGESLRHYPECPSKMVLVERRQSTEAGAAPPRIIQLETEPCHIYHFGNVYETPDGQSLKFNACCLPPGFTMEWQHKLFLGNTGEAPGVMQQYVVDLRGEPTMKRVVIKETERVGCEFPFVNQFRHCVRAGVEEPRFFYLMGGAVGVALPYCDVVKNDLHNERPGKWHSEGIVGEPCFIPRLGEASATHGDEDDGWIIVQHYIPKAHRTEFAILDAKDLSKGPICRLKLGIHIPISFHGTFTHNVFVHPKPKVAPRKAKL
eukprot:TRINITY_DN23355_c0_g1_i1.p1 TRINITY_DN23355_c0_g1~~TRINITY_DN23355_c0_g1_i1.p1  ORF type:complete len:545 (+),score=173.30 TRINITY_DN23355_c0_g1_i1:52-1635(+)